MLKRLLDQYERLRLTLKWSSKPKLMIRAVKMSPFIRKGQEQLMVDYMQLDLVKKGRL